MQNFDENNFRARLQNASKNLTGPAEPSRLQQSSTGSLTHGQNTTEAATIEDVVHGPVSITTYRALLKNSRLKLEVNEKYWKSLGYTTVALLAIVTALTVITWILGAKISEQITERGRIKNTTLIKALHGGYMAVEAPNGRFLLIRKSNVVGPPSLYQCAKGAPYWCLQVRKL